MESDSFQGPQRRRVDENHGPHRDEEQVADESKRSRKKELDQPAFFFYYGTKKGGAGVSTKWTERSWESVQMNRE